MKSVAMVIGILLCPVGWGQNISTSQINGTVRDPAGLAMPGAEVKATQTDTGLVRSTMSGSDGSFVLTNLPVGPYELEVSKEGFSKYVQSGLVLQVASNPNVEITLKVGSVSEQVEVEASAALVETRGAGVGTVMENQRVVELPLNGRQVTDLIYLSGMATQVNGAGLNSGVRNYPTQDISVAGGLANGLTYSLDGATHNDPYNNLNLPLPFPDALQEFKVETSALPAQYGHHSSAAVNVVTKSGTNSFHGDLFEFFRNGDLNARNAFASSRDQLKRNQFGGTLGGRIRRDKLFFFVGQQTTITRSAPPISIAYIPTAQMLQGDFSAYLTNPACTASGRPLTLGSPFDSSNHVSPTLFSQAALKLLNQPSFPHTSDPCGRIQYGSRFANDDYNSVARVDYTLSSKQSLFARYSTAHLLQPTDYDPSNVLALVNANLDFWMHSFTLGHTYLIGAGTVSSFRGTFNRSVNPKSPPAFFDAKDLGINIWVAQPKFTRLTVAGGFNIAGGNATPSTYNTTDFQFAEDVSVVRGAHQLGFGADFVRSYLVGTSYFNATGPFTFSGQVTGLGLADFLLGQVSAFTQAGGPSLAYQRMNYVGLYAQDSWKLSSRLSASFGMRWDPYLPVSTKYGYMSHFDPALFTQGFHTSQYTNAPAGLLFPGDPGYPGKSASNSRLNNFAPRFSLAWDPRGDGRMSVRVAYGIFYDLPAHNNYIAFAQAPPFSSQTTLTFPRSYVAGEFENPWGAAGNPYPISIRKNSPFIKFGSFENFPLDPKTTYSQQWNLSVQKQIGLDWLVTANYLGTRIVHMWGGNQGNPGVYISGTCSAGQYGLRSAGPCSNTGNVNARRLLDLLNPNDGSYYGSISQLDDGGNLRYNGLVLSVQRRASKGLTVQANYTGSHCIADLANTELGVAGSLFMIPGNRRADLGNCPLSDRRHLFNLSAVYQTPKISGGALQAIARDWQISGIVRLQTGPYFGITSGLDQALTGQTAFERPNQVLSSAYTPGKLLNAYLNLSAFSQPTPGTYGNMGLDNLRAPGFVQIDMGLVRTFPIRERVNFQFRAEAFNLPNHMNPDACLIAAGSAATTCTPMGLAISQPATFGKIQSARDPRIMQLALKFVF
jgi:Carboxypeptidase regulatory-like domain